MTNQQLRCDEPLHGERVWWSAARYMRGLLLQGADPRSFDDDWLSCELWDARRRCHQEAIDAKRAIGHAADAECGCDVCTTEAERWFDVLHCFDPSLNEIIVVPGENHCTDA